MDENTLSYKTLKNVSYGFFSFFVPILLSIIVTPIVAKKLGETDYGIYILTNSIIGFLGLTDLGLTGALTKHVAMYYSQKQSFALKQAMNSANSLFLIIGILGVLIFFILGKFFLPLFKISGASERHILIVFMLGGAIFFINAANSVYTIIPAALQRFDIVTKLNLAQLCIFSFSALGLVLFGFQLKAVMLFNLLAVAGITLAYRYYSKKIMPDLVLGFEWTGEQIKKLYSFGFISSLASIGLGALNNLDRLIIPAFLGPVQLAYYSVPGNIAQKTAMVMGSVSNMFFPLATSVFALGETDRLGGIYRKIVRNLFVIVFAVTASIMLFGYKIMYFWFNKVYADNGRVVVLILAVTYFILAVFGPLFQFLMGMGREKVLAKWSVVMAIINLILLFPLIKAFGIIGAAWAYLLAALPVVYLLFWIEKEVFRAKNIFAFYSRLFFKLLLTLLPYFLLVKYSILPFVDNLPALIILGPLSVILYMVLYRLFGFFEAEDLQIFNDFLRKILEKFGLRKASS